MHRRCGVDQCHILKNKIKCTLFKAPKELNILTAWNPNKHFHNIIIEIENFFLKVL